MRKFRNIFHIILCLAILSTGLPLNQSGDINRDGAIGLRDAIMSVRELARAASGEATFSEAMEDALTSLAVTAGLKTVIRPMRDPGADRTFPSAPYFIPSSVFSLQDYPMVAPCVAGAPFFYHSATLIPPTPPPRVGLV